MLERLATWFLNTYVAEYVGNINTDQLSIGILRGAVELEKLPLKKDALKKLNLPIEVKSGFIGKLKIEIPFRHLKSQPWVVQVDQLYLIAGPSVAPPYDEEAEHRKAITTKRRKLDAMEEQWREEQRSKGGGWFWSSFTSSFASNIAENLQIIMNDIHIRYEDSLTIPGHVFAVGMTMESLSAQSTDDEWEPKFMSAAEKARKLIDLHNLAVYWDTQLLGDLEGASLVDALISAKSSAVASMDPMTCSSSTKETASSRFIIKPASGQAQLVRNCLSRPLRLNEGPRFQVEVNIDRVAVVVLDKQYNVAHKMVDHFRLYSKGLRYRKWRPVPENGKRLTGKQLWKFAIDAILNDIREKNWHHSPKFILTRAHQNVEYVRCYVQYLTKSSVPKEVKERLAATEDDQSFEELCLLRQLAMNEVKQQRELAEAAKSRAQEQLPAGRRGWFSQWLPGWKEGGGGKDKGDEISVQPGEPLASKEELEDELLDAIGYDPSNNSIFMRDRMLAVLSFSLREGSLQLSDTSGEYSHLGPELITEMRFSELLFKLDYRPKMKFLKLDTSLHSITVVDHLHPDSLFPILVQPKGSSSAGSIGSIFWRQYSTIDVPDALAQPKGLLTISFTQEHHRNHPHVIVKVNTLPLDIVLNSDTIGRVNNFIVGQRQHKEIASDWTEQLWLRLKELQAQTASEVRNQIEEMLLGEASKVKLTIDLDVAAPHLIIPEDFTSQDSSLLILDLGHFKFGSDKTQESSSMENPVMDDMDDDDEFATPLSSPPSEEELCSQQFSQPAPPTELQSALVQSISQSQLDISEKYLLTLSEFQVLVGKVEDKWKAAIKSGHSSLHIMDKFTLSMQIERHSGFAVDTKISNVALSASLPSLSFHFDEQKVTTLMSCINILTTVVDNTPPPPPASTGDNGSLPPPPSDNPDTMRASMYYSVIESSVHPKMDNQPPPQDATPSFRRLRRMTTVGAGTSSRMLVAVAQLLDAQLSIDRVELTLSSRGKNIIQLVVPGVNLSYLKRPYDSTFESVIQNLCVVDQLQSFGPEFELLVCTNAYPLSSNDTDSSSTLGQPDLLCEQSVESGTISSPPPLLSLSVESLTPFSPKHHAYNNQSSLHISSGLQLVSIKCSGLDVLVNQETAAELLGFFQRTFSHSSKPVEKPQAHKKPQTADQLDGSLRSQKVEDDVNTREVDAQFDRLTVRLVRGVQVPLTPSFSTTPSMSSSSSFNRHTTCHLIGEVSLVQLAVKASFGNEMKITGKLASVNVRDLTNTGRKYSSIFSSGNMGSMTDASSSTIGDYDMGSSEAAFNFTITQKCSEDYSEHHIDVLVAAMCYVHSTNFVSEVELFISEFRQYLEMVKKSLQTAAVGVAKGIVSDKSRIAEGLSKLSMSLGHHQSMKLLDEDSTDGAALEPQSSFSTDKCYIKVNVQSPVIVLPRSSTSHECIVVHLGEMSFVNEPGGFDSVEDVNPVVDRAEVLVSNISLHSTKSPEALSLVTSCRNTPNSKDCFKVLREASLLLRIDWHQSEGLQDEGMGVAEADERDVFDTKEPEASTSEIVISVTVEEHILLNLPKDVFDQVKSTLKNILRSRRESPTTSKEDMPQPSPTPTSPENKKSVQFQSYVTAHAPQSSLPQISASFSLPRLTLELKETIEEKEHQLVFIDLKQFKVEVEQVEQYRTNFDLHLHSIVIEDLLQPKDSKYRYLFASSDIPVKVISPVATPMSSLTIPSAFQRPSLMVGSLTNPLLSFSHYMSSPKPARARTSPLRAFVPSTVGADGDKHKESDEKVAAESSILEDEEDCSDTAYSLRDLVCIKAYYVSKNCPDFKTKYESISGHVDVDFSSVSITVNLQTWVVLLDFFGIGIPTPPSSRSPSPPPPPAETTNEKPLDMSSNVFGREQHSLSFSIKKPFSSAVNLPDSSLIDQMLSYHDFDMMAPNEANIPEGNSVSETSMNGSRLFQSSHQAYSEATLNARSVSSDSSTVWGIEDKPSFQIRLSVHSLSVTFNKPEHPFAKGIVSSVKSSVKYQKGNIAISGTLGQASVTDLTDTGAYYRERLTTAGDQALQFNIFKYGKPDPDLLRSYDISVSAEIASIRYLHTMRFLKELLAFCMHFPQLIDAFQRMKAVAQGNLVYNGPDRKPRVQLDIKMDGAILLIPKHAFSPELACGNIDRITVSNRFLFDGKEGTFTYRKKQRAAQQSQASKRRHSVNKAGRSVSSVAKPDSILTSNSVTSFSVESSVDTTVLDSLKNSSLLKSPASSTQPHYVPAPVDSNVSSFSSAFAPVYHRTMFAHSSRRSMSTESMQSLLVERDRLEMEQRLASRSGPCLMDCIEVRLESVDVFSAHRVGDSTQTTPIHQRHITEDYKIVRDPGDVLKEKSSLTLLIERNLHEDMCREVPDISIDGCLSVTHVMLDKMQLELVKGLLAMNLGEDIEEFEKPSTLIHDPVSQPVVAEVWTNFCFRIDLVDVQLEFMQSREMPDQPGSVTQSLAKFDIQCSQFSFESRSNQTKTINLVSQAVIGYDTRYEGCDSKPNLFTEVLRPRASSDGKPMSLQVEIHVNLSPKEVKASIILNKLRLIGVFDLLQSLKCFVIDGLPEEQEIDVSEDEIDYSTPKEASASLKRSIPVTTSSTTIADKKPPRAITLKLNVAETDLVVVEDPSSLNSNAVILKGTLVMVLKLSEAHIPTVSSSIEKLELFSCYLRNEEETALSILDPVTVSVELTAATPTAKPPVQQVIDVGIPDLNFRLSYRDLKLFVAIAQSLPFFQRSPDHDAMSASTKSIYVDNALVKKLLPLGFTRAAIRKELVDTNGDINEAANNLLYQLPDSKAQGVLASIKKEEKKFIISSVEVHINSLSLCLIDDCFNRDVPLLDFTLSDAHIRHHIQGSFNGQLHARLIGEYYNRNISAWEPVIEPWIFDVSWKKIHNHLVNDANGNNTKPDQVLIRVESPEQLCINVTSSLIHLLRRTQEDWKKDLFNPEVDPSSSSQQELVRSLSTNEQDTMLTNEATKMTNIEKGLYLLHSVRVVGQRQKTPFYPFQLLNSTGLPLRFATVSSIPSQVYVSASTFPRRSQQMVKGNLRESEWRLVEPDQRESFDCRINNKMRHKDTRQLVVHQLVVKVAGWKKIAVPISVDKVGIFLRELEPSNDDELDAHVKSSNRQKARLVFAILLKDNCKIVNVRSGLVIHNKMELPVEIQLKNEQNGSGYSIVNMGQLPSNQYKAIPLHLIDWDIHVRPCGLKVQFSASGLPWKNTPKFPMHHVISCGPLSSSGGGEKHKLFRFCAYIKREASERNVQDSNQFSSYVISLAPPLCVINLLPCDMCLSLCGDYRRDSNKQGDIVKKGKDISFYEVDPADKIEFRIHLENFVFCEVCRITKDRVGVVQAIRLTDTKERRLILAVSSEFCGGAIKVYISCQYWLINHTGLPLIFKQDGSSQEAAGQFEEHEIARSLQPLLFSYTEPELPEKCSMRLGKGTRNNDRPLWCHRFPMISGTGVRRVFCKQMDGRPDREYQIGVEVKRGRGKLSNTRIVTFVTRYQLENTTQYKIAYVQRHQLKEEEFLDARNKIPVAMPGAVVPFHWPRYDLDQLFCIRVKDINHCRWSGGFKLSQTNTFYINMRGAMNRSVFVRVEVILKGATFHVIFSDAANFPPPFRLENLSQVPVLFFQSKVNNPDLYRTLKPSQAVPYSWDEPCLPHFLALQVQGATEAKEVSLMQFGQLGKLYYESYVYIAASATFVKNPGILMVEGYQKDFPECPEYVLEVPQGTAVIFSKKDSNKRSQLWRQSGEGRLVHIASSETRGHDMVLDISREAISNSKCELLVVRKKNSHRNSTQTWNFRPEGRLVLSDDNNLCVQSRSPNTLKEGADVVLAQVLVQLDNRVPDHQLIGRLKHTPGSGILSLKCSSDGPTRVLTITDENKKYTHLSPRDDWIVVEHGVTAPVRSSCVDQQSNYSELTEDEEDGTKMEISLSLMLDKGVGISLINHVPEELVFASLTGVQVDFVYSRSSQQFNANIQHIQVDNQLPGSQTSTPILVFPTPLLSGAADISHPILHMVVERVPHKLPFVTVFRHFTVQLRKLTILLEEKLLFKLLQWLGVGSNAEATHNMSDANSVVDQLSQSMPGSLRSNQVEREFYFEEFGIADTEFRVSMHTTSQLPDDLQQIKYHLGFPLVKFEAPISLGGYCRYHVIGTGDMYMEILVKHYKEVITNQALRIGLSVDFLGNPIGLFNDITSGVTGVLTTTPDVMGLVRDVTHGMSDTTSKLTGAVSDLLGQATFDASYQEEREQVTESCQSSSDHLRAGLIGLSSGVFGGLTSIFTQPVQGAKEDGLGGFIAGLGKGVVGTVAKPIAGVFSLASGATAAIRETTSRVSRVQPASTRLRRCCVGPNGALPCYSEQQARGQEYLWRLNDGNFTELLVSYERLVVEPEPMKVIISSDQLYFFQDSPPSPNHLHTKIDLEELVDCRLASSKSIPPNYFITIRSQERNKPYKFLCSNEATAQRIVQLIQYAKNLNKERKNVLRTHRLHSHEIW